MALERLGLGAIVQFDGANAVAGMGRVGGAASKMANMMSSAGQRIGGALQGAGTLLTRGALAFAPMSAAIAFGSKQAIDFEAQMSSVQAVLKATPDELQALTNKAKDMGATTQFSATEAAFAIESLGRAGFNTEQNIAALDGVMNLAAADGIELAQSADIVASTIRSMGLAEKDAGRVADVLTKASQRTNTNVLQLGEAMKFAAPVANTMGISLATTTAILGTLADNGIKSTLAGTAFKNALLKLADPTKEGAKLMQQYGIKIFETKDGNLDLVRTFKSVGTGLKDVTSKTKRAAILSEIFGIRGTPAVKAFDSALANVEKNGGSKLDNLLKELNHEFIVGGAAQQAAATRLDNIAGAMKILKSAAEAFNLEFFGALGTGTKEGIQQISGFVQNVALAMRALNDSTLKPEEALKNFSPTVRAFALGLMDAINAIKEGFSTAKTIIASFFQQMSGGEETTRTLVKWATIIGVVGGLFAPIIAGIGLVISMIGGALSAAFGAISGTALLVIGGIALAFMALKNDGETLFQGFMRIFNGIANIVVEIVTGVIIPYLTNIWQQIEPGVMAVAGVFKTMFGFIVRTIGDLLPLFKVLGSVFGTVFGFIGNLILKTFAGIMTAVTGVISFGVDLLVASLQGIGAIILGAVALASKISVAMGGESFDNNATVKNLHEFVFEKGFIKNGFGNDKVAAENFGKPEVTVEKPAFDFGGIGGASVTDQINDISNKLKGGANAKDAVKVDVNVEDKSTIENNTCVNLDSREVAIGQGRHKQEVKERRGMKDTPWQRRMILEQGAA